MSRKQSLGYLLTLVSFLLNLSLAWSVDIADLRLTLTPFTIPDRMDGTVQVEASVENHGLSGATNIVLTFRQPADCNVEMHGLDGAGDWTFQQSNHTLTAIYPVIEANSNRSITLTVRPTGRAP